MNIGEKIKARRKQLGLTQSEVAGDKISRNMLSLIESGNASPSLDTLYYIAEKLNIRIEYLVSTDISQQVFDRIVHENEIFIAFRDGSYEKVVELVDIYGQNVESLLMLATESAFRIAREKVKHGSLASAKHWISVTEKHLASTTYENKMLLAKIALLSSIAQNIQSPKLNFDQQTYELLVQDSTDEEYYRYYLGDLDFPYRNEIISLHIKAKNLIRTRNFNEAIALLCQAEDSKTQDNYDAYTFFGIYTDLENCYKELLDFEKAYRYATKKISMMEYFKS